ncbi:MAG: two-component system, cell cycle sensor histidine kinase and response regulator CckA [Chloroflexota bacterium]|jgi:signal transduction histidine kinase/CheY-like chemotaxis protein|nr:two-component system, cell cycle sensor histidine kinase and response regulator CckA [Chloroflexota bacterium]
MDSIDRARRWISTAHPDDKVEQRQAVLLQSILVALVLVIAISTALALVIPGFGNQDQGQVIRGFLLIEPLFLIPLWLLRIGHFPLAATATVAVFEFVVVVAVLAAGPGSPGIGVAFAIPMTIAALVLRRPGLVATTVIAIATILVYEATPGHDTLTTAAIVNLSISLAILGLVLDRFGISLRDALAGEIRQRKELEASRDEVARQAAMLDATNRELKREMGEREMAEEGRRAIEAKVLEVQKLESLGVLAGGIAHDFNNLLVAILGNASLALLDLPEDSPARQSIADIEVASQRAGELARQMLAYSGRSRFQVEPIELGELVRELMTLLQVSIGKSVVIKLDLSKEPIIVDADAAQLRQVVMNLVINAADAIGDRSGFVTIRVGRLRADAAYLADVHPEAELAAGHYAALEVSDTGMGMDTATQARIFDPFFTTKFTGRGLGLAAVLGIVRGHGGALRVYSEIGRGSTFRIVLPLSASSPAPVEDADEVWFGTGRVLAVDDDAMVRSVARRLLQSFGLTVVEAAGGREAIDCFAADPDAIDAILLDLTMPDVGGAEVVREVRAIRPDVPIVLMSGYHEDEAGAAFDGDGLAGFVQKPFTPADLAKRMRVALGTGVDRGSPTGSAAASGKLQGT